MKLENIKKLHEADLNVKVAKLDGYKFEKSSTKYVTRTERFIDGRYIMVSTIMPDYCRDLNAMASAVKRQVTIHGNVFYIGFNNALERVLGHHDHVEAEMIHATARQRAEAFVLAVQRR